MCYFSRLIMLQNEEEENPNSNDSKENLEILNKSEDE